MLSGLMSHFLTTLALLIGSVPMLIAQFPDMFNQFPDMSTGQFPKMPTLRLPPFMIQSPLSDLFDDNPAFSMFSSDPTNQAHFDNCSPDGHDIYGQVSSMTINPCERANLDDPCTFTHRRNYTITIHYKSLVDVATPKSSIVATDKDGVYQYSGQSFDACDYTRCPIRANHKSKYVMHFQTLASYFNHLSFNVTQGYDGPSLFCIQTRVNFQSAK